MNETAIANHAVFINHHIRKNDRIRTERSIFENGDVGMNDRATANPDIVPDERTGINVDIFGDFS